MKNLFNFLKKEQPNVLDTVSESVKTISEIKIRKEKPEWNGKSITYVYDNIELTNLLYNTLKGSIIALSKTIDNKSLGYYIKCNEKVYDPIKDRFSKTDRISYIRGIDGLDSNKVDRTTISVLNNIKITEERYKSIIDGLSKNGKKRLNIQILKLKSSPGNTYRLFKILNYLEMISSQRFEYIIGNFIEDKIIQKRKAYKEILKYIKMDLVEELKKSKIEFKEAKGDFYKRK